jgi:uncharacterized paraquat-inducible protein A
MSPLIIVLVLVLGIIVAIVMAIDYSANQHIKCPYCDLEFMTDLLLLKDSTLSQCPFCHKWITVRKMRDRLIARKLFA